MFPVLVTLGNREGLLKPGMTGEASVLVERRENVLAVPNDAVRNVREGVAVAVQLGLNPDSVQAEVQRQLASAFNGGGAGGMNGGGGTAFNGGGGRPTTARESRGEVLLASQQQQQQQGGRQFQMPEVSEQDCAKVRDAFAKHPDAQGKLQTLFQRMRAGELDMQQMRTETEAIYKTLGVDGRVARACQMRDRGGQGSAAKGQGEQSASRAAAPNAQTARAPETQGGRQTSTPVPAGEISSMRSRARPALVFLADSGTYKPRVIRVGAANLDYTEVVSGLKEGDRVAMLSVAQAAAQRSQANERMRSMTGGGMPGMTPGGGTQGRPQGR
jgi:hypothetical protein